MTRALALISILALASCGEVVSDVLKGAAGAALGADSGPSLDVQAGKNNNRATLGGTSSVTEQKVAPVTRDNAFNDLNQDNSQSADEKTVEAEQVETVVVNQIPTWLLAGMAGLIVLFGFVGWMSPQPKWVRRDV
jgi:hypothetical protein